TSYSLKLTLPLLSTLHLFYAPSTSPIYTLSLHDALPIYGDFIGDNILIAVGDIAEFGDLTIRDGHANLLIAVTNIEVPNTRRKRSEEHTSELQSRFDLVCRLLLEKKKNSALHSRKHKIHI